MHLPAHVRNLDIDYTALSLVVPEKVRFRVKIESQDKDWRELVNVRHVEYTNLPPKHRRFDLTQWAPSFADLAKDIAAALPNTQTVLDGEIVCVDKTRKGSRNFGTCCSTVAIRVSSHLTFYSAMAKIGARRASLIASRSFAGCWHWFPLTLR